MEWTDPKSSKQCLYMWAPPILCYGLTKLSFAKSKQGLKNPVKHKVSVLALENREWERERERGISNGGVWETKRKPLLINIMFYYNSNSGVSVLLV